MKRRAGIPVAFVPLRARLSVLISVTVLLFGGLNLLVAGRLVYNALTRDQSQRMRFAATLLAQRAEEPLLYDDRVALDQLVRQSSEIDPNIDYIIVTDTLGWPIVHTFESGVPVWVLEANPNGLPTSTPLVFDDPEGRLFQETGVSILDGRLGTVRIGVSERRIHDEVTGVLSILAAMVGSMLLVGLIGARLVARRVTNPLDNVSRALETFRLDGPPLDLVVRTRDELAIVAGQVRAMASRLQDMYRKERERERELIRLERLAALGTLAAGIAHEVNNPLAGVKNAAQRLKKHSGDADRVIRYVDVIVDSVGRIERTVMNTLDLSRPASLRIEPVDVLSCVTKSIALAEPRYNSAGIDHDLRVEAEAVTVMADPDTLVQVFLNLLLNAADAVAETEKKRVTILLAKTPLERIAVTFRDSGPGVPREMADSIFDPFFTTKRPAEGTGLGLAVSWASMMEMGGDLRLVNPGRPGASFRVELAVQRATG